MSKIKLCKSCRSKNVNDLFYSGYYNWLKDDCYECPMKECKGALIDINLSKDDFDIITSVSQEVDFIESMINLKETDPIEYQLKMSQFKSQLAQTQMIEDNSDNKAKCPICNSTNISKISVAKKVTKIGLFGIFGAGDLGKAWKCNNCGSRF